MTVDGPVPARDLGVTLMHEHLIANSLCWRAAPRDQDERLWMDRPVSIEALGFLRRNPLFSKDNLRLDDEDLASSEILRFRLAGGQTVVDTTSIGLGRDIGAIRRIAHASGLQIVAGCGFYVDATHPPWIAGLSIDALCDAIVQEIHEGVGGSGVRPGIIGEIGTSLPITPREDRVLRAAALAQCQTGLALTVHMAGRAAEAVRVLDILDEAGADLERVILGHMDDDLDDLDAHIAAAKRGAYVEYDAFGAEWYFDGLETCAARDIDRVHAVASLADRGFLDRVLLSQDIWLKQALRRYGGYGYDHIPRSIAPMLCKAGLCDADLKTLLVANPARVLSGESTAA